MFDFENEPWLSEGHAGVDEVGIGPLAGPVVAAAVILDPDHTIAELTDSKLLSARKREALAEVIRQRAVAWGIGWASEREVDELNVLRASHAAMQRAVAQLSMQPTMVWVDGNKTPMLPMSCVAVVQGDKLVPQISAASVLAKVARDRYMVDLDVACPGYGFAKHKGYPTKAHLSALSDLGVTPHHRRSFAPVAKLCGDEEALA
jgi:ribonuclease HII